MEYKFGDLIILLIIIQIIINLVDVFKNMILDSFKKWQRGQKKEDWEKRVIKKFEDDCRAQMKPSCEFFSQQLPAYSGFI